MSSFKQFIVDKWFHIMFLIVFATLITGYYLTNEPEYHYTPSMHFDEPDTMPWKDQRNKEKIEKKYKL